MQKSFLAGTYSLQTRIQNPSAVLGFRLGPLGYMHNPLRPKEQKDWNH
jgi:hypothetical protein